jgi:hypothetical protein
MKTKVIVEAHSSAVKLSAVPAQMWFRIKLQDVWYFALKLTPGGPGNPWQLVVVHELDGTWALRGVDKDQDVDCVYSKSSLHLAVTP